MRIQTSPDLLLATVDNAAAGAPVTDGDKAQGEVFAQVLQTLPTAGASATFADAKEKTSIALNTSDATTTPTSTVELPADSVEPVATSVIASAVLSPLTEELSAESAAPTTMLEDAPAETETTATSARMMAALRREFVPTPVRVSKVELPPNSARSQTAATNAASSNGTAANSKTATMTVDERTPGAETPVGDALHESQNTTAAVTTDAAAMGETSNSDVKNDNATAAGLNEPALPLTTTQAPGAGVTALTTSTMTAAAALNPAMPAAAGETPTVALTKPVTGDKTRGTATPHTRGNRGTALPTSGKALPAAASNMNDVAAGFTGGSNSLPVVTTIDAALNRNMVTATYDNTAARLPTVSDSTTTNFGLALPNTSNAMTAAESNSLLLPPVFTSTFVMGSAGWSEETAQSIRWMQDDDMQSADIQLHPAELGRIDISIDITDGQASVQLVAGSAEARELLEKAMPSLRELLAQNGMSLGDSQVAADHSGREARAGRFNAPMFALEEPVVKELPQGRPALFRSSGASHRIDYYV